MIFFIFFFWPCKFLIGPTDMLNVREPWNMKAISTWKLKDVIILDHLSYVDSVIKTLSWSSLPPPSSSSLPLTTEEDKQFYNWNISSPSSSLAEPHASLPRLNCKIGTSRRSPVADCVFVCVYAMDDKACPLNNYEMLTTWKTSLFIDTITTGSTIVLCKWDTSGCPLGNTYSQEHLPRKICSFQI